jgi:Putative amidase domain
MYSGMGYNPPYSTEGMGTYGDNGQWYFDFVSKTGSPPWVAVPQQYTFLTRSTTYNGPVGSGSTGSGSICGKVPGDVVQLYNVNGGNIWDHEGMIVTYNGGTCSTLSNYTVDAHTTDRKHYALSYWASFSMRFVHITGYYYNPHFAAPAK